MQKVDTRTDRGCHRFDTRYRLVAPASNDYALLTDIYMIATVTVPWRSRNYTGGMQPVMCLCEGISGAVNFFAIEDYLLQWLLSIHDRRSIEHSDIEFERSQ